MGANWFRRGIERVECMQGEVPDPLDRLVQTTTANQNANQMQAAA